MATRRVQWILHPLRWGWCWTATDARRSSTPVRGSQFTSAEFTDILHKCGIRIGMDGKGAWRDNVFVERLWRSVKYEEVCLKAYDSVRAARGPVLLPRVLQRAPTPFFPGSEDAR